MVLTTVVFDEMFQETRFLKRFKTNLVCKLVRWINRLKSVLVSNAELFRLVLCTELYFERQREKSELEYQANKQERS